MSEHPRELYVNDNYLDNSPSVHNNFACKPNREKSNNEGSSRIYDPNWNNTNNEALKRYMTHHAESIEDYYSLQRNQTEIVQLCKQRIAQYFSLNDQNFNDEDVVKALKIAQRKQSNVEDESTEQFVGAIIEAIIAIEMSKCKIKTDGRAKKIKNRNKSPEQINSSKRKSKVNKLIYLVRKEDLTKYPQGNDHFKSATYNDTAFKDKKYLNNPNETVGYSRNKNYIITTAVIHD